MRQELSKIGERLTLIRGRASQATFAPLVGIHKNTLGTYERGEREPGALALSGYAALGWNINWVLTGEGEERIEALQEKGFAVREPAARYQSQTVSDENLTIALELADKVLGDGYLPRPRYARLVRLIYEGITGGLPVAEVLQFGERAGRALQQGDDVDVGESRVGRTGRTATG
ncbi:hypothetical protein [uncultured Xanthomonas sp.]|uniref:helix-turn-helix domain-containing protein n=1 Tax=uncultured Xanthomonas sp. TaxID=152831 RepID=UPI0025CE4A24|nr:hypothetical protein [uncultured Xanthomonas sp.]